MTQQSFKEECDINNIMRKHQAGQAVKVSENYLNGRYADLPHPDDHIAALNQVIAAQQAFDAMPSSLRSRFHNDPGEFLAFMADEKIPKRPLLSVLRPLVFLRRCRLCGLCRRRPLQGPL